MTIGLVGRKSGMTRIFTEEGVSVPVTVLEMTPNRITQVKSSDVDGYTAVQVTAGAVKASRVNKAEAGHFAKAGVEAGRGLWEFRVDSTEEYQVGGELNVGLFEAGQKVDVTGQSKGKGFQGGIKRWICGPEGAFLVPKHEPLPEGYQLGMKYDKYRPED